jgi:tetratricopeptide (TPR) repeat protein
MRAGQYADAATRFSRGIEINDRLLTAYVGLGVAQHAAGRPADADASLEMAASIEPNSTLLYAEVARLQLKCAVQQEAESWLGLDGSECAGPPESRLDDLVEQQIEHHQALARERPAHADVHYRLGLLLRQRGRLDEAIASFRHALAINPAYTKALIKLGLACQEAGRADEAIRMFQRALELHPDYVDVNYRLGVLFASRRQFELAVEHFGRAAARRPEIAEYREMLAMALENIGLIDRAKAMCHRVREMMSHRRRARPSARPSRPG